jgi:hypothetical protein
MWLLKTRLQSEVRVLCVYNMHTNLCAMISTQRWWWRMTWPRDMWLLTTGRKLWWQDIQLYTCMHTPTHTHAHTYHKQGVMASRLCASFGGKRGAKGVEQASRPKPKSRWRWWTRRSLARPKHRASCRRCSHPRVQPSLRPSSKSRGTCVCLCVECGVIVCQQL